MAYVRVDIDLEEVDTSDLLEELQSRYFDECDTKRLHELIKDNDGGKLDLFIKNKDRFTVIELEEIFKEHFPDTPVPKEQLSLL